MKRDFIHLHTHSHYSLLNALPKISELIARAKAENMSAIALSDNGNLYGAISFYKKCKRKGIKPIIGVDFYVALRTRNDKEAGVDNRWHRLVLLAKNKTGYKNLIKLVTRSHTEGFYYKPRIDHELMQKYAKGLIAIIPTLGGETSTPLRGRNKKDAQTILERYKEYFGPKNVFFEITHHPEIDGHSTLTDAIIKLARETNTMLVALQEVYYLKPDDKPAYNTLRSIQSGGTYRDNQSLMDDDADFSFISASQAKTFFKDTPEAIENTANIAAQCNLELTLGKWMFPHITIPKHTTYDSELERLVNAGLKRRDLHETKEVRQRITYELDIIKKKGYAPYFLVVADLMRYANQHNILSTIRGSTAGSLVSFLMSITNINPIEYNLPFERFLNPERPSPPDIDMDFADDRRDEVIQYARKKYGEDKVAQIGTFGTMMARGSVRDTARALGYDYATGDKIARLIPFGKQGFPMTIDRAMALDPELERTYHKEKDVRDIINMAKKIEGCARHISVHAAGVVISPVPLTEIVPTQPDPKHEGKLITQYDMHEVEDIGLLKFDFLGLKNLAILADAIKRLKKIYDIEVDIEHIPLDDKKTYTMLARGETMGVFQLGSSGITRYLKALKPAEIHDINAMVALYRPGPMESIPSYIERKHNPKKVVYLDPRMEKILDRSYGLITYQDDVLLIAVNIAGYSWLEADKLRKAMGKKIPAEMEAQKEKFLSGCVENDMTPTNADQLWRLIEPFAAYGFGKAHAASYGRVAYQTAYMKANYPVVYMAAVLTADAGDVEKIAEIINECKRMNIPVLAPNINESLGDFTVVTKDMSNDEREKIRFGLHSIKNFGEGIASSLIKERKAHGHFMSLANFLDRVNNRNFNKKSLEALIKSGALDTLGERGVMFANIDDLLTYSRTISSQPKNQDSLFHLMKDETTIPELRLRDARPASMEQKLAWEKELLGLYISGHPLDKHKKKLQGAQTNVRHIKEDMPEGTTGVVYGLVEECKQITTKNGEHMAFLRVADPTGSIEIVAFPQLFKQHRELLSPDQCVGVKGRVSHRNGRISIVAERVKKL